MLTKLNTYQNLWLFNFSIALSLQIYVIILKEILGRWGGWWVGVLLLFYQIAFISNEFIFIDPWYSWCWDQVQTICVSRHHSPNQNKMMLWALCFATRNIIAFRHLDYDMDTCSGINIPLQVGSYMYQLKGQHLISEKSQWA